MVVTLSGSFASDSGALAHTQSLIVVSDDCALKSNTARAVLAKAASPTDVMLWPVKLMLVRAVHELNAPSPIVFTSAPSERVVSAVSARKASLPIVALLMPADVSLPQCANAPSSTTVIEAGIVTEVRAVPLNAKAPMLSSAAGNVISDRAVHPAKAA